jgi:excisionase family DNA binding protein
MELFTETRSRLVSVAVIRGNPGKVEARRQALMSQLFLTVSELTELVSLDEKTILKLIHDGQIPARKFGMKWMISTDWLRQQQAGK